MYNGRVAGGVDGPCGRAYTIALDPLSRQGDMAIS